MLSARIRLGGHHWTRKLRQANHWDRYVQCPFPFVRSTIFQPQWTFRIRCEWVRVVGGDVPFYSLRVSICVPPKIIINKSDQEHGVLVRFCLVSSNSQRIRTQIEIPNTPITFVIYSKFDARMWRKNGRVCANESVRVMCKNERCVNGKRYISDCVSGN